MSVSRVRYRERQILRQSDLSDEQSYRLAMRRRHNIAQHGWGIVSGLELSGGDHLQIDPGRAVDGYGRELFVPHAVEVGPDILDSEALCSKEYPRQIDVWLLYNRLPLISKQNGPYPCGKDQHDRWREEAHVRLELAGEEDLDPRYPESVAESDRELGPHQASPDDPAQEWPIYLGRVQRTENEVVLMSAKRAFASLTGAVVTAPSGRARMMVENEIAGARRVFAISTADDMSEWQDRLTISRAGETDIYTAATLHGDLLFARSASFLKPVDLMDAISLLNKLIQPESSDKVSQRLYELMSTNFQEKLSMYDGSNPPPSELIHGLIAELNRILQTIYLNEESLFDDIDLRPETEALCAADGLEGETIIYLNRLLLEDAYPNEIRQHEKPISMERGLAFNALIKVPEIAKPWQIYRTEITSDVTAAHQLRFEIAHPGDKGDPMRYKLAVGHSGNLDDFSPRLIVRSDCTVIVKGDIKLDGELVESPITADPNDPRFVGALLDNWLGGISSAAGTIDAHYDNPLELSFTVIPSSVPPGGSLSYTISIRNTGQVDLRGLSISEIMSLPDQIPQQTPVTSPSGITAGQTLQVSHTRPVPYAPDLRMTLIVTAIAAGPDGSQVQSTASAETPIIQPEG